MALIERCGVFVFGVHDHQRNRKRVVDNLLHGVIKKGFQASPLRAFLTI
jgi:hypothetical protein